LGAAGNRLSVTETGGREATYTYDDLYRLTSETITGDLSPTLNGVVAYSYDPVGNRQSRTSTVAGVPSVASQQYDVNDRLTSDGYDANGNTVASSGNGYVYDFENRLLKVNAAGNQHHV
jgi:YD repeat-containing protein